MARWKSFAAASAACLAGAGIYCAIEANAPDRDLVFVREVPTTLPLSTLSESLRSISNWPKWFVSMASIRRIDITGSSMPNADQKLMKGATLRFDIASKRAFKSGFSLEGRVTDYVPDREVTIRITQDNSGKILKLLEDLQWRIELLPPDAEHPTARIRGTETARTHHWRARLIAALAERTLMNQVFYPDLMALGSFTQPVGPNPYPVYGQ